MESKSTSNLFYSPPALTQHVDYQSKAEKRKAELEALRQQSITKQKASQLKTAEAPKEFADFDQKQRSFLNEQRHRQRHAKDLLHQFRADEQMVLSHATPRRRPMSDASTANRLSRSPDAFASVYHSPDYSVVPFPESVTLSPNGDYGDDDSTNENAMYYPAACTDSLPDVEQSVQYYDDHAIFYQAQEEEQHQTSDHAPTFTPTNAQRPPSLDPTESGTTGATSTQSTTYYNSPFSPNDDISPLFVRESAWSSPLATGSATMNRSQADPTDEDPSSEQHEIDDPVQSLPSPTTLTMPTMDEPADGAENDMNTSTTLELNVTTTLMDNSVIAGGDPMSSFESCQQDDTIGMEQLEVAATLMTQGHVDREVADTFHVPAGQTPAVTSEPLSETTDGFEETESNENCTTPKSVDATGFVLDSDAAKPNTPTVASTPIPAVSNETATELSNISLASPANPLQVDTNDVDPNSVQNETVEPLVVNMKEMKDIQVPVQSPVVMESPTKESKHCELENAKNDGSPLHHDTSLIESTGAACANESPSPLPGSAPTLEHHSENDADTRVPSDSKSCLTEDETNTQVENLSDPVQVDKVQPFTTTSNPQFEDATVPIATCEVTEDGLDVCGDSQPTEDDSTIPPEPSEPLVLSRDAEATNDSSVCTKETVSGTATAAQEVSICSSRSSRTTQTKTQTKTPSDWSSMFARYLGNQRYTR